MPAGRAVTRAGKGLVDHALRRDHRFPGEGPGSPFNGVEASADAAPAEVERSCAGRGYAACKFAADILPLFPFCTSKDSR